MKIFKFILILVFSIHAHSAQIPAKLLTRSHAIAGQLSHKQNKTEKEMLEPAALSLSSSPASSVHIPATLSSSSPTVFAVPQPKLSLQQLLNQLELVVEKKKVSFEIAHQQSGSSQNRELVYCAAISAIDQQLENDKSKLFTSARLLAHLHTMIRGDTYRTSMRIDLLKRDISLVGTRICKSYAKLTFNMSEYESEAKLKVITKVLFPPDEFD